MSSNPSVAASVSPTGRRYGLMPDRQRPNVDGILLDDKLPPKKQQHTAKRIFERLRDEYGLTGGITIVKYYVAGWHRRAQEMFVPLEHPPGHAQVDFGEAIGVVGGPAYYPTFPGSDP